MAKALNEVKNIIIKSEEIEKNKNLKLKILKLFI